jgi:hypothetical protein
VAEPGGFAWAEMLKDGEAGPGMFPAFCFSGANCTQIAPEGHLLASVVTYSKLCNSLNSQLSGVDRVLFLNLKGLRANRCTIAPRL